MDKLLQEMNNLNLMAMLRMDGTVLMMEVFIPVEDERTDDRVYNMMSQAGYEVLSETESEGVIKYVYGTIGQ